MVIAARNPVHSVLYLILTFFNAAALFVLTGAEFLSMILLVVYIGAVAVLFLFVVMMLDVDFASMKRGALEYAPIGALIGVILAGRTRARAGRLGLHHGAAGLDRCRCRTRRCATTRPRSGDVLHGLHLLLPDRGRRAAGRHDRRDRADAAADAAGVKRQSIVTQVGRKPSDAIEVVDVETGKGL
jgi:NADH-quinone oxidoreductase subunit J